MLQVLSCATLAMMLLTQQAEDPATLVMKASGAYEAGNYADAARLYEAAIEAGAQSPTPAYNAACCYGLLGDSDEAFAWIDRAIEAGWRDVEHLKADTDLE
jgi:tetratricopeptide (TPR) repeat protein